MGWLDFIYKFNRKYEDTADIIHNKLSEASKPASLETIAINSSDLTNSMFLRFCYVLNLYSYFISILYICINVYYTLIPCNILDHENIQDEHGLGDWWLKFWYISIINHPLVNILIIFMVIG